MEPEYEGFCKGCNGFSKHLMLRRAKNNYTNMVVFDLFCPDCRKRFGLFPFGEKSGDER